jgi:crossover junction endodeoxyribonuclease RuvC
MAFIIGIDPSLSGTSLVALKNGEHKISLNIKTKKEASVKGKKQSQNENLIERFTRLRYIYKETLKFLLKTNPEAIAIEGYGFAGSNLSTQAEVTGVISMAIMEFIEKSKNEIHFFVIPPTSVKKFVTGKGNCDKNLVLKEIFKKWNFDTNNDNEADAYSISKICQELFHYKKTNTFFSKLNKTEQEVLKQLSSFKDIKIKEK